MSQLALNYINSNWHEFKSWFCHYFISCMGSILTLSLLLLSFSTFNGKAKQSVPLASRWHAYICFLNITRFLSLSCKLSRTFLHMNSNSRTCCMHACWLENGKSWWEKWTTSAEQWFVSKSERTIYHLSNLNIHMEAHVILCTSCQTSSDSNFFMEEFILCVTWPEIIFLLQMTKSNERYLPVGTKTDLENCGKVIFRL